MLQVIRRPRWMFLVALVLIIVLGFVALGFWQLRRLDERRVNNAVLGSRIDRPAVTLEEVLASGLPADDLEYTVVALEGVPDPSESVFVRSQLNNDEAGYHQVIPVDLGDGEAVLVNVGWVPLGEFPTTVPGLEGPTLFEGYLRPTEIRPAFGQEEPEGTLTEIRRIDVERLQQQYEQQLLPFWIQLRSPDPTPAPPVPAPPPELDEGSHLAYALQWFSFALISIGGLLFLIRREAREGGGRRTSYVVDDEAGVS
jgi:surfeit locus 1 family protein